MSQRYTPGLAVEAEAILRKRRELPLPGRVLVKVGEQVKAQDAVLSAELPGDLQIVRVADRLGLDPLDVWDGMLVKAGDEVNRGDVLCRVKTFFGMFTSELTSPVSGTVEFLTEANAHIGIRLAPVPLSVNAYIDGKVVEVEQGKEVTIETEGAFIQGIFGVGGERQGIIRAVPAANDETVSAELLEKLGKDFVGAVLVGGQEFSLAALEAAARGGAVAVVTGSIDSETLGRFVGFEIGVSITGDEDVPLTLIITEGFGGLPLSTSVRKLAEKLDGRRASLNGATQVRAGAMRPELIVPLEISLGSGALDAAQQDKGLRVGAEVRVVRVPYFGRRGRVTALPREPSLIETGARVRVLHAELENGAKVVIPRANVELV